MPRRISRSRRSANRITNRLAKLKLSGGHIHNAALNAAFCAAAEGSNVNMHVVLEAVKTELLKLDRLINEADFHWPTPVTAAGARNGEAVPV